MCDHKGPWVPKTDSKLTNASIGKHYADVDSNETETACAHSQLTPVHDSRLQVEPDERRFIRK
ncbi:hypothetical protein Pta6605_27960 [Pseudomonas amygdali pv. tabaci]|nr:hypothetical protein Pta6605_27960 [Pseudomonas amygdali pv. tabaci]